MRKINELLVNGRVKAQMKVNEVIYKTVTAINNDRGADDYTNLLIKVIMGIVIGALVMGILYVLFKDTLLPMVQERIVEMFDFAG